MRVLRAIALSYDPIQDRILAVVDPGALDSWAFWLTRRLVVALLERLPDALEKNSPRVKQVPSEHKSDLAAFEREAAMATTVSAMSQTDNTVMRSNAVAAELAVQLSMSDHGDKLGLELRGERGGQAAGVMGRAELHRILQMVHDEAVKAGWLGVSTRPSELTDAGPNATKPIRH